MADPHVVILGNPLAGFRFIGPFPTRVEAEEWAAVYADDDAWNWVAPLADPDRARQ